jgi:hypothetical protein
MRVSERQGIAKIGRVFGTDGVQIGMLNTDPESTARVQNEVEVVHKYVESERAA